MGGQINPGLAPLVEEAKKKSEAARDPRQSNRGDGRNQAIKKKAPEKDAELAKYYINLKTSPRPKKVEPIETTLPLKLEKGTRIALIGNLFLDAERRHGPLETLLHQHHQKHELTVRNLAWPADEIDLMPRPDNFGDLDQHQHYFKADVIIAAYGFNESIAWEEGLAAFKKRLDKFEAKKEVKKDKWSKEEKKFDQQKNLVTLKVGTVPERLLFTKDKLTVKAGQPVKLVFSNPDVTEHNLLILAKDTPIQEIGEAANLMAADPEAAKKDYIPDDMRIMHATKMLKQRQTLRFIAPSEPGNYPYLCTFPGHWTIMKGVLVVK